MSPLDVLPSRAQSLPPPDPVIWQASPPRPLRTARPGSIDRGLRRIRTVRVSPPALPVMVSGVAAVTVDVVTVNRALVPPAGTLIEAGTTAAAWLLDSVTVVPPDGAASVSRTVPRVSLPPTKTDVSTSIEARETVGAGGGAGAGAGGAGAGAGAGAGVGEVGVDGPSLPQAVASSRRETTSTAASADLRELMTNERSGVAPYDAMSRGARRPRVTAACARR